MNGLDTNVLVRYLTQDDASQSRKANAVFERAMAGGERLHVDAVVLCELVWVLRTAYGHDRATVASTLEKLLDAAQLSIDGRDLVREAARRYAAGSGDFADHVLGLRNRAAGCDTTLTFDRAHKGSDLFTVL
jgi:predicted nucleic-acid-binding protein